jgi:uncharacterized membrane protein
MVQEEGWMSGGLEENQDEDNVSSGHRSSVGGGGPVRVAILRLSSGPRVLWVVRVLCILGIGVAGYLTWTYLDGTEPYCGGAHGCAGVQNSPYAQVAGIPVPLIGLAGYLVLLVLSLLRAFVSEEIAFYLPLLSFGAALIGVLYSAYLTYLEAFVIRAWCYWCVTSAVIITAIWGFSILDLRRAWAEG